MRLLTKNHYGMNGESFISMNVCVLKFTFYTEKLADMMEIFHTKE